MDRIIPEDPELGLTLWWPQVNWRRRKKKKKMKVDFQKKMMKEELERRWEERERRGTEQRGRELNIILVLLLL